MAKGHSHSHGHPHHHGHHHDHGATSLARIRTAFFLNASFALLEIIGGFWSGSLAILADGWHDLGDAASLAAAYAFERKAQQAPTSQFTYGFRRYSLLSAVLVGVILVAGSALIIREAIPRFFDPGTPRTDLMLGFAALGIVVNGFAAWRLRGGESSSEKVISWHLIEDVLGWVAVLVGSLLIRAFGWTWLDPLLAIGIALFVVWHVVGHTRGALSLFLQRAPEDFDVEAFRREARALPDVVDIHDLHAWSLDGHHHVLSVHAVVRHPGTAVAVKTALRELAQRKGHFHLTVEIESREEECGDRCE